MNNILFKKIEDALVAKGLMEQLALQSEKTLVKGNEKELAEKNGTFRFKITEESVDRHGDTILFEAWDTKFFEKNPVVLWAHKHDLLPAGRATKIIPVPEEKAYYMEGIFASHDKAQEIREAYDEGFVFACSVGFIPEEYEKNDDGGYTIKKAQLLEVSIVPVPAHPEALTTLAQKGFNITDLIQKGMLSVNKENEDETEEEDDEEKIEETEDQETKEEKIKRVLEGVDEKELENILNLIKEIRDEVVDAPDGDDEEEEEDDEEDVEETEEEKQLKKKKFLQDVATAVGEVLHELKPTK